MAYTKGKNNNQSHNKNVRDSSSKIIFDNAELCSQLLRGYTDIPLLKNVKAEDIEDVSERYVHMFTSEREADTVKKVKISEKESLFMISLIEHKSYVDYNITMQLLRYMVYIWEDYEKEMEQKQSGISKTKAFRYPPILPIVYYEGNKVWTAGMQFKDRILLSDVFQMFLPDFTYKLIDLNRYTKEELVMKQDDLSLLMMINRIQSIEDFGNLALPEESVKHVSENTSEYMKDVIIEITRGLLRHLKISEQEIRAFTEQIKEEKKMGYLFENFEDFDFPAARKKAIEEGLAEGRAEGLAEGLAEGRAEGEMRVNRLVQLLLAQSRLDDIKRAVVDEAYQKQLFEELGIK